MIGRVKILSVILLLSSCLFDSYFKNIGDDFRVGWVDQPQYRNVYFRDQGVFYHECVVAINWSDEYIITKNTKSETDSAAYYIIDKKQYAEFKYNDPGNPGRLGPFDSAVFYNKIKELGFSGKFKYEWD